MIGAQSCDESLDLEGFNPCKGFGVIGAVSCTLHVVEKATVSIPVRVLG